MQAPDVIRNNPNAAVAVGSAPLAALVVWGLATAGADFDKETAGAIGSLGAGVVLFFFGGLRATASAVWEYGIVGCGRRILRGRPGDNQNGV